MCGEQSKGASAVATAEAGRGTVAGAVSATGRRRSGSRGQRLPVVSLTIIAVFVVAALFANVLSPADPEEQTLRQRFTPPVWEERGTAQHLLGTDRLGRD